MNAKLTPIAVVVLAFLATLLVHSPAINGEFLFYDDARFVVRNKAIEDLGNTGRFFTDLSTTASVDSPTTNIYRPVRTLSWAILTSVFGKSPSAFHWASVLLHALTAAALVLLLMRAKLPPPAALVGALAWSLHPVTVESSAWICSLGDLWAGLFCVLGLLAHDSRRSMLALGALLLALLGKESAIVLPGLWLAWDYLLKREDIKRAVLRGVAPGLGLVLAFLVVRSQLLGADMSQVSDPLGGSHSNAIFTMLSGFGFYLSTVFFPIGSTVDVRVAIRTSLEPPVLIGLVLFATVVFAAFRGSPRVRLGAAWFLLALVPASNILVPLKIPTADRFLYIPLMGLAFAAGSVWQLRPRMAIRLAPIVLIGLAALTIHRIGDWRDDASLIAAWKRVNPKSERVLWAEASLYAKRAMVAMVRNDLPVAAKYYGRANDQYRLFVQNVQGRRNVPIQIWMEAGELSLGWAELMDRFDRTSEATRGYTTALTWFRRAFERQKAGRGRVVEEEVERAATVVAQICTRLADMQNPEIDRTIREGMLALQFLGKEFGQDIDLPFARLLLAHSVRIRAREPEKARKGFEMVLAALDQAEERGTKNLSYWRAHCIYYRSFLEPYDRDGVRSAYVMYLRAAEELPAYRYWALFHAGRTKCSEGRVFGDAAAVEAGRALLKRLTTDSKAARLKLPADLKRRIESELSGCVSRG